MKLRNFSAKIQVTTMSIFDFCIKLEFWHFLKSTRFARFIWNNFVKTIFSTGNNPLDFRGSKTFWSWHETWYFYNFLAFFTESLGFLFLSFVSLFLKKSLLFLKDKELMLKFLVCWMESQSGAQGKKASTLQT